MAVVDAEFRKWMDCFRAANPKLFVNRDHALAEALTDTAQFAFTAGRKAQRDYEADQNKGSGNG